MPEVAFTVRWPDGATQDCYSPSRAIEQHLCALASYPKDEFLRRALAGLEEGGNRVKEMRGFFCTGAAASMDTLRETAAATPDGHVVVEAMAVQAPPVIGPRDPVVEGHHEVIVVGGGQAGLTVSALLAEQDVGHLVLERHRIGHAWRAERWDAFCLVTPNWQCRLPGHPYAGDDADGFMVKDDIVAYVEAFAEATDPPILEGVTVTSVRQVDAGFRVETSAGTATADQVVLAVGGYHRPKLPAAAARLPAEVTQLHSSEYRNPPATPDGAVLIVGSGQSGAQIAEDLHLGGREVHMCVGSSPRVARFYRGRDVVAWLEDMGHYDMPIDEHPMGMQARREPNHYVTGRDGGHDLDLRAFAADGMRLHGRLLGVSDGRLEIGADLAENLDGADETFERIKDVIDEHIDKHGIDAPGEARYEAVWAPDDSAAETLDLVGTGIRTVIWATGYDADWSWVEVPAFDGTGYPTHLRGVTSVEGLYVVGLPWLHTWGSGRFAGLTRDAEHLCARIAASRTAAPLAA